MDSALFRRKLMCRRMAANGLGIILFRHTDWLHAKGTAETPFTFIRRRLNTLDSDVPSAILAQTASSPSEVAEFLHSHLSRCDCPAPVATRVKTCQSALNRLMAMVGCRNPSLQSYGGEGPIGTLVADFDQHLTKVCGLSPATRFYRRSYARVSQAWPKVHALASPHLVVGLFPRVLSRRWCEQHPEPIA